MKVPDGASEAALIQVSRVSFRSMGEVEGVGNNQSRLITLAIRLRENDETRDEKFTGVTVHTKGNIYFEGRVISHTVILPDGERKTVGVILPGSYHFGTQQAERMEIIEGNAEVVLDGHEKKSYHAAGKESHVFDVPANSGFTITVSGEPSHYICSFLGA